jgi:hypothetical protein
MMDFLASIPWWGWAGLYAYIQVAMGMFTLTKHRFPGHRVLMALFVLGWPAWLPALGVRLVFDR